MKYKSIFISDTHLGSKESQADALCNFLKEHTCETMYLVGDIIDGWKVVQNKFKWSNSHTKVVKQILKHAKKGTRVIYVTGNHDEFLRPLVTFKPNFAGIEIVNKVTHKGLDGKKYLVIHGDLFDGVTQLAPWLSYIGDIGYETLISLNRKINWIRIKLGLNYWSFSKWLKYKVKKAVDFIFHFELNITEYAKRKGYDGVICGHIHHAEIKMINSISYMNTGDWVESCTALIEHKNGDWEIKNLLLEKCN